MKATTKRVTPGGVAKNTFAWAWSIFMLIPLALIIINAFKTSQDANSFTLALPEQWDFSNFGTVIEQGKLGTGFLNSLLYAGVGTVATVLLAAMAAYVFSRRRSKLNKFLYMFLVLGIVIPMNYVSLMKVMQVLLLNDTQIGIIFLYIAVNLPFMVFLMYGFVSRLPVELDEAAVIDGCSPLRLFFSVILPLMKPVLITSAVLCLLNMWNEFVMPLYFLNSTDKWPMTLAVYNFFGQYMTSWNLVSADILLTILPVIAIFLICQKYIMGGQTVGAVKG
ncbi:MAG: carbohydrate ABC transporter permease [Eubacteriales bacterium]